MPDNTSKLGPEDHKILDFVASMVANEMTSRTGFMRTLLDPKRDINGECQYPETAAVDPHYLRDLHDREPVANRANKLMPKECWQKSPAVTESDTALEETEFERAWDDLPRGMTQNGSTWYKDESGSTIWEYLARADELSGIGQFGVMLLGLDDGRNLQDPCDGVEALTTNGRVRVFSRMPDSPANARHKTCFVANGEPRDKKTQVLPGDWRTEEEVVKYDMDHGHLQPSDPIMVNIGGDGPPVPEVYRDVNSTKVHVRSTSLQEAELAVNAVLDHPGGQGTLRDRLAGLFPGSPAVPGSGELAANEVRQNAKGGLGRGSASDNGPFVTGTEFQYSHQVGMGMASPLGPSMSGTDQQYFGVQFGPSQKFADKPAKTKRKLLFLRVFDESLVQIVRWEWNIRNPRFGMPVMYRITLNDPRQPHSGVGLPMATVYVHWSRVIHFADNLHSSEVLGVPRTRPILNPLLDIRKVRAGGAEGYWKSCINAYSLETHPQLGGDVVVDKEKIKAMMLDFFNGLQRTLLTSGMTVKTLAPAVVDPTPHINVGIEAVCIQLSCPVRVFRGSERGELASSQDDEAWNGRKVERQMNYLTPRVICPFIDRLIQLGVLPEPRGCKLEDGQELSNNRRVVRGHFQSGRYASVPVVNARDASGLPITRRSVWVPPHVVADSRSQRMYIVNAFPPRPGAAPNAAPGGKPPFGGGPPSQSGGPGQPAPPGDAAAAPGVVPPKRGEVFEKPFGEVRAGYSVEWPDPDALGVKDRAAVSLQFVQALAAFIQGNCESAMPLSKLFINWFGMDEEEVHDMLEAAAKMHETDTDGPMTMPAAGAEGGIAKPPPPPPPMPGMPGGPPHPPMVLKPGERIATPPPGKPPAAPATSAGTAGHAAGKTETAKSDASTKPPA